MKQGTIKDGEKPDSVLKLSCFGIRIELFGSHIAEHSGRVVFTSGTLTSEGLHEEDNPKFDRIERAEWETYEAAVNTLESLVLAHAVAGIEVTSPAYEEGIETTVEAVLNHLA